MRRYKQIEYKAGITIEVIKCIPQGEQEGRAAATGQEKDQGRDKGGQCETSSQKAHEKGQC